MYTRKLFCLVTLMLISTVSFSQVTNEIINFDNYINPNDNDLVNHFYGMQSLVPIPTSGITGGCLMAPDSNNWGNDNSRFCSKYKAVHGSPYTTSISFYYDQSLINSGSFDRAVSIWAMPHMDPNHYIIATVSHQAKIEIYTYYNFSNTVSPMSLQTGHWYNLTFGFNFPTAPNPYYTRFYTKVDDLGTTGMSPPVYVDSISATVIDTVLASDEDIEISITGATYGGTRYLDNFTYSGIKSVDSCSFTNINRTDFIYSDIKIITSENILKLKGENLANKEIEIFNMNGKKIISSTLQSTINDIDVSKLSEGIYVLTIFDSKSKATYKFSISR